MVVRFPPVEWADETGLLAVGGDLEVATLELAYRSGIFPWPISDEPILWFAPPWRAVLEFDAFHLPRRLQRELKKAPFEFRIDADFPAVIRACADYRGRQGQHGTWLTPEMIAAYIEFHHHGFAHSFETYAEGRLVGGLYGVRIGRYFAGESMFHRQKNASKFALIQTVRTLQAQGLTWMDVQVMSPLLASFGAREIPRSEFMRWLRAAVAEPRREL